MPGGSNATVGRRHVSTNLKAELGKIDAHGQTLMSDGHALPVASTIRVPHMISVRDAPLAPDVSGVEGAPRRDPSVDV
jgi:hypothetical protein